MEVLVLCDGGVERHEVDELPGLLKREDGLVWVDIPVCDPAASHVLSEVFGFHSYAVRDCVERNHVSKFHVYADSVFTVLHAPQVGRRGHVHYVELDQFVGHNFLVTVHGPLNPAVDPEVALLDTRAVLRRVERGSLIPGSPFELSHAIVTAMTRREIDLIAKLAQEREFLHGVIEFYQTRTSTHTTLAAELAASAGVQQNDDMRRITAWVAIVAVPTAVTGFFGQNVPYPGFGSRAGVLASVTIMLILAVALYAIFRHKKWL